ncbi:MAG: LPXTG cell wall anchor domain-containing protein [Candidatus Micrarchaeia archaeon]
MKKYSKKTERLWKIALVVLIAGTLLYLLNQIISDPRWLFSENSSFIVLIIFILAIVGYLLRKRRMNRLETNRKK